MVGIAGSRGIVAVGVLLFGIAQASCELSKAATNSLSPNAKAGIDQALAKARPTDRLKGLAETAKKLSIKEIPTALQAAKEFQQLRERAVFHEAVLKRWSELAPREAFGHIAALPESRIKVEAIRFAADQFATDDCDNAARAVEQLSPGRSRNDAVEVVAGVWARKNVKQALRWANALPAGFARETAFNTIRFVWVHSDPAAAAQHVKDLPASDTKNALLTNIAGNWGAFDSGAALRWANALTEGPERDLVIANIAESWADTDPVAAAAFALKLSGELRRNAVAGVISRWATQNPEAALNWALKHAPDEPRAVSEALNLWASVDSLKAGQWVEKLPRGPTREAAIQNYVEAVVTWEPSEALRLASTLKDESARIQQSEKCLQRWMELDKARAAKWLAETNLQVTVREK